MYESSARLEATNSGGTGFVGSGAGNPRHALRPPARLGDRDPRLALERTGRTARAEVLDAGRGVTRRPGVVGAERHSEAAGRRAGGPGHSRCRAGRAQPEPQPRARGRATRGEAARRARRPAPSRVDAAGCAGARATARGQAPPRPDEGSPEAAGLGIDSPEWTRSGSQRSFRSFLVERTRLLDNLGQIRREVGPITPELSDALADHMNIRRGEVHEVVSFYSFLQVPTDACVSARARLRLLRRARAARGDTRARSRSPASATATSRPSRRAATRSSPARDPLDERRPVPSGSARPTTTLADYEARGGLALLRDCRRTSACRRAGGVGPRRLRRRGVPDGPKWAAVSREPGPRVRRGQRRRGRAGTIKDRYVMELRPHLLVEGTDRGDALARRAGGRIIYLREEYATARARLGTRDRGVPRRRPARRLARRARGRRRRVHLRRGDGDARVDGGPPRDAAAASRRSRASSATSDGRR